MKFKLLYSDTSRKQIKKLHPQIKPQAKQKLTKIGENPYLGKYLERDLSGYLSFRARRYRIIYRIREDERVVEVHHVGHRKDIYELFGDEVRSKRS